MILYFADRSFQILGMGSTDGGGLDIVNDMKTQEIGTGGMNFSCTIPFEKGGQKEAESLAAPGNYILRQSGDDREFYTIIESEVDTGSGEAYIYAEEAGLDLLNEIALPYEADREYPISHYIQRFANDSGFEIGINEIPDLQRKLKWENEGTATSRILSTAEQFGNVEISFSFEVKELSVIKKYINIYQKRGKDTGIQLRLGREVDRIVTKKSIANLATALYVTGDTPDGADNPITLEGISYDDGRFFLQGPWLKDKEANKKWSRYLAATETGEGTGYIMGTFSYETLDKEELLRAAIDRLEELSQVELNYEVDIAMLPEHVEIGDTVNIVDDEGELYLSARILKLEISIADDTAKATLGDYLIKDSGISQKIEELAAQFQNVAKSRTLYTWIAYADDAVGSGISVNPQGKTYMGTAANQTSDVIDVSNPFIYTWAKIKGEDGKAGVGILSTSVDYQAFGTGTHVPYGEWENSPPLVPPGGYLWTRTVITYSDGSKSTSYSVGGFGTAGTDGADGVDGTDGDDGKMLYGTCSTSASTAVKSISCSEAVSLYTGLTVMVKFTYGNTATSPHLNVNNLGARAIYINGQTTISSGNPFYWGSGASIQFTYNGSYWIPVGHPATYHGSSSTSAGTSSKVADISGIVVCKGTTVCINFNYANTASSPTLNISSIGAKAIYTQGVPYAYWTDGATVDFSFDGTYWRVCSEPVYANTVTVGNSAANNVYIDGNSVNIRNGTTELASFEEDRINIGNNSDTAVISLCDERGFIEVYKKSGLKYLSLRGPRLILSAKSSPILEYDTTTPKIMIDEYGVTINKLLELEFINVAFSSFTWTNTKSYIKKQGKWVHIHVEFTVSGAVANNEYAFATIPGSVRPMEQYKYTAWCANASGHRYSASARITTSGSLYFIARVAFVEGGFDAIYHY